MSLERGEGPGQEQILASSEQLYGLVSVKENLLPFADVRRCIAWFLRPASKKPKEMLFV